MLLAVAGLSSAAIAQNNYTGYENASDSKHQVFTNGFWDNWFINFGGGGEMLLGNTDVHADLKDRISPTFNVGVGKWFTPGLGLRLQYSGFQGRGYTANANGDYVDGARLSDGYYKQKFKYMNLHGDILFDVTNMLGGYKEHRVYSLIPYLGFGFTHNYTDPKREALAANAGIINRFRLGSHWDANIELSIMGTENKFDGETGGKFGLDGNLYATVGFTYRFSKANFDKPQAARQIISEAELRNIRDKMNTLAVENNNLKTELARKPDEVVQTEVVVVEQELAPRSVFFTIGSAKVSPQELVNLGFVAEQMKENKGTKFVVRGYADSATGTAAINKKLSLQRANSVIDALVTTYGIARDRFSVDAEGGVAVYDKPYLNRMVLIEAVK